LPKDVQDHPHDRFHCIFDEMKQENVHLKIRLGLEKRLENQRFRIGEAANSRILTVVLFRRTVAGTLWRACS
jgi:hypothetical protein